MDNNKENITTSKKIRMRRMRRDKIYEITEKKVVQLNKSISSFNDYCKPEVSNLLLSIMQTGADEFTEKTGRNMTYSEMRQMFG